MTQIKNLTKNQSKVFEEISTISDDSAFILYYIKNKKHLSRVFNCNISFLLYLEKFKYTYQTLSKNDVLVDMLFKNVANFVDKKEKTIECGIALNSIMPSVLEVDKKLYRKLSVLDNFIPCSGYHTFNSYGKTLKTPYYDLEKVHAFKAERLESLKTYLETKETQKIKDKEIKDVNRKNKFSQFVNMIDSDKTLKLNYVPFSKNKKIPFIYYVVEMPISGFKFSLRFIMTIRSTFFDGNTVEDAINKIKAIINENRENLVEFEKNMISDSNKSGINYKRFYNTIGFNEKKEDIYFRNGPRYNVNQFKEMFNTWFYKQQISQSEKQLLQK